MKHSADFYETYSYLQACWNVLVKCGTNYFNGMFPIGQVVSIILKSNAV